MTATSLSNAYIRDIIHPPHPFRPAPMELVEPTSDAPRINNMALELLAQSVQKCAGTNKYSTLAALARVGVLLQGNQTDKAVSILEELNTDADLELGKVLGALRPHQLPPNFSHAIQIAKQLQSDRSPQMISKALEMAAAVQLIDSDEAIAIYKEIIARAPTELKAYLAVLPLLKNWREKRDCYLEAKELARKLKNTDVEIILQRGLDSIPIWLSLKDWQNPADFLKRMEQFMPETLKEFMRGKNEAELAEFIIAPLPQFLEDGRELDLKVLDQFEKEAGGFGFNSLNEALESVKAPSKGFKWLVMTRKVFERSQNQSAFRLEDLVRNKGFALQGALEAAYLGFLGDRLDKAILHNTSTLCCENILDQQLFVGFKKTKESIEGYARAYRSPQSEWIGVGGILRFETEEPTS